MARRWIELAGVLAAAVGVTGCGGARHDSTAPDTAPAAEWTAYRDAAHGFSVTYPADWVRATETLTPRLYDPHEILALATYRLRPGGKRCAQFPVNALEDLGPSDAFITIQERRDPAREGSRPRPHPFPLDDHALNDADACTARRGPLTMWVPFTDRGRAFYALYAVGPRASKATRSAVVRIFESLEFEPPQ